LLDLKQRGLTIDPQVAIGDGALGFWKARTAKTRGCVSRAGILAMVFKLTKCAEQKWRKLKGHARLAQVVQGVRFKDGLQEEEPQRIAA